MNMQAPVDIRAFARSLGTVMTFGTGDIVFRENEMPRYMYVVLSGAVAISRHDKLIETVGEGDAVGILGLLDSQPRNVTARATADCELAVIDQKRFRYMVEEVPNFVWFVMNGLAQRLRHTNAAL